MSGPGSFDVAVVGRGAIGLAAALAFARAGLRVALVAPGGPAARSPATGEPSWDRRVYALSPASRRLLDGLDVWPVLDHARIAPVYDMRLFQERAPGVPDPVCVRLDAYRGRVEALAWIIEHRVLMAGLAAQLADPSLARRVTDLPLAVIGLQQPDADSGLGRARLQLADGRWIDAALVIGADGLDSAVRGLADLPATVADLGQTAIVTNFDTELGHQDCAWQWFGRDGIVALLPLPADDRPSGTGRVSLVWSTAHPMAADAMTWTPQALAVRIQALSRGALGALTPISEVAAFPLRSVRMGSTIGPALVLVGDAAHAVHPMAGQGMNLGFGDVAVLAETLTAGRPSGPFAPSRLDLRRYERRRSEPVLAMQSALGALGQAFGPLPVPLATVRNLGWSFVARSPWIQRWMIGRAVS